MSEQQKIIIGIAGEIGAGKGTVTSYLMQAYHAHNVRYSAILQDILRRLDLPYNRENLALLAEALRTTFGQDILSRALLGDIARADAHIVVVDGIRKKAELDALRTHDGFVFLFVDADLRTRYERIHQRNEKADDASKTYEQFVADHARAADREIPQLKQYADIIIDNNHDVATTHKALDDAMQKLL